jgi:hypothetical protein
MPLSCINKTGATNGMELSMEKRGKMNYAVFRFEGYRLDILPL